MSFTFVQTAYADMGEAAGKLIGKINKIIINPLIVLVFAIALVVFLYGLYEMLANGESEEERTKGKQHMLWGVYKFSGDKLLTTYKILCIVNLSGNANTFAHSEPKTFRKSRGVFRFI
jgi:hypothetical protein